MKITHSKAATVFMVVVVMLALSASITLRTLIQHTRLKLWNQKHTGPVTFSYRASGSSCLWFERPNREIMYTCFDNPPDLMQGVQFDDIVYVDDTVDLKHLIGMKFKDMKVQAPATATAPPAVVK